MRSVLLIIPPKGNVYTYIYILNTTSVPSWMPNNLFFNVLFWMHNNPNVTIKIFRKIYLFSVYIFPSVPSESKNKFVFVIVGIISLAPKKLENCP